MASAAGSGGLAAARGGLHARAVIARIFVFALLLTASCGAKVAVDATQGGAGAGGGAAGDCGHDGMPIPASIKACEADTECTIKFVAIDCCGTQAWVGIDVAQSAALSIFEQRCNPFHGSAPCGCDPGPAQVDDGNTTTKASAIHAACMDGQCMTFVE